MNSKTAAELQLETLKKLKEQQGAGKPRAGRSSQASSQKAEPSLLQLQASSKKRVRRIPLSESAWAKLRESNASLKVNQALGDWAVELLLKVPQDLQGMPEAAREELFNKLKDWAASRGLG